ncbi:MAG: type II toxin-antitoxin system HicB family antitoxin [Methylococcales bacterium]|nr:type II toxin-antitoxin system HicB family antitoxin [Methylococcales bacterium]
MLYPAYIHSGNYNETHGATIPDFPGCFSAADNINDLPVKIQEAVELYCEGESMELPAPTDLSELISNTDYENGVWLMVDIDTKKINTKSVRINISLPEALVTKIDDYASRNHLSRSGFLAKAAEGVLKPIIPQPTAERIR